MDSYIGTIMLWAANFAPRDWAFCDGKELQIHQYQAVFSLLGTTYGGNGQTTFALPNLPTVTDVDKQGESKYIICLNGIYPSRDW